MENFFEATEIETLDETVNTLFSDATSKADYADEIHSIPVFRYLQLEA
jgi:hypothetical protein